MRKTIKTTEGYCSASAVRATAVREKITRVPNSNKHVLWGRQCWATVLQHLVESQIRHLW